jgi:hypothetical protein
MSTCDQIEAATTRPTGDPVPAASRSADPGRDPLGSLLTTRRKNEVELAGHLLERLYQGRSAGG